MPCCLIAVAAFFPRVALVIMWFVGYTETAFQTHLWPLLGFLVLPFTTCGYAIAINEFGAIDGWGLALVIIGVLLDLAHWGGGGASHKKRRRLVRD